MGFVQKAIRRLDEPENLTELIQTCGRNHYSYGADPDHIHVSIPQQANHIYFLSVIYQIIS